MMKNVPIAFIKFFAGEIPIFFEDQHLIILSKPSGLLSQSDISGTKSLVDILRQTFKRNYVGLIHRLDQPTSGLMIIAKRSKAAQRISNQLIQGKLIRHYHAWLTGKLPQSLYGTWTHYLKKDHNHNQTQVFDHYTLHTKLATLSVDFLKQGIFHDQTGIHPLTLCQIKLETGRSHQIRAQAAHQGFFVLGDQKYGKKPLSQFYRLALHSSYLQVNHSMDPHQILKYYDPITQYIDVTNT